jgi:hypothetical protein
MKRVTAVVISLLVARGTIAVPPRLRKPSADTLLQYRAVSKADSGGVTC